jgi:hypothetical protein
LYLSSVAACQVRITKRLIFEYNKSTPVAGIDHGIMIGARKAIELGISAEENWMFVARVHCGSGR